ncbi:MAG: sigma-70 family RNA polymerase sigma factor [Spirosomataceae bacterium]
MNENLKDIAIIERIKAGDKSAYRDLVHRHKDFAFTVAYRILNHREEAEEAAQDAFIQAFSALNDFNQTAKFTTWFYRIVFNAALGAKRRQKPTETITESHALAFSVTDTTQNMHKKERLMQIQRALAQLSPDDVTMITLFYLKEHSLEEIAAITAISSETIKVKLHRARKRLAEVLRLQLGEEVKNLY